MSILSQMVGLAGNGKKLQGKVVLGIVAFVLLSKGFDGLQKAMQVRLSGNAVTGEVVQHLTSCTARIREAGRWQRFDVPCNTIRSLRQRYGYPNVRSSRNRQVMVRFVRNDGQVQFAKVRPSRKFIRWRTPVGTKVPLVYNETNPSRIQPQPDWSAVQGDLLFFFGGLGLLAFLFWSTVGPMLAWLFVLAAGSASRNPRSTQKSKPSEVIEALQKAVDGLGKSAAKDKWRSIKQTPKPAQETPREQRVERPATEDYQAKSAALETSRGAVKRMYHRPRNWRQRPVGNPGKYEPGSWFGFAG